MTSVNLMSNIPLYRQYLLVVGPLLAYYLVQFKACENRFIHITQGDTEESIADYAAHPRALQSTYCDCISNRFRKIKLLK